jgi:membrane protease YdiL (CAAX protease family)
MPVSAGVAAPVRDALAVVAFAAALARFGGEHASTLIGLLFLGACHVRSWRFDDARVRADGLALGGIVAPLGDRRAALVRGAVALVAAVAITFPPFVVGWVAFVRPRAAFDTARALADLRPLAELVLVALPEEAFFRGYLQSRLAERTGARVGPVTVANLVASTLFAVGHFGTSVSLARASVFFPSLLFGLLRERTGGVVVPALYHALCNVLSRLLFQGFGLV